MVVRALMRKHLHNNGEPFDQGIGCLHRGGCCQGKGATKPFASSLPSSLVHIEQDLSLPHRLYFLASPDLSKPSEKQGEEEDMGNALGGRKKAAKIMKIDGTTFKVKPPAQAITVLRDHPGHALLESDEVKRLALRARPLDPDAQLQRGKLYFLVELTQLRGRGAPRRAWSGQLQVGAKERLESLRLTRRSMSDLSLAGRCSVDVEEAKDGAVRLRVRLPKVQVEKLMHDSRDAAEAANKIMQLCVEKDGVQQKLLQPTADHRKEKRTRFVVTPDEIIV
ncbi:unnamed protein product [Musa acuminata var. zebrina]